MAALCGIVERVPSLSVISTGCSRGGAHLLDVLVHGVLVAQRLRGRKIGERAEC